MRDSVLELFAWMGLRTDTRQVDLERKQACEECRRLAEHGDIHAQNALGLMCFNGTADVPQDYGEALKWFHLSAEQGDAWAQKHLAGLYLAGHGVPQDYSEALRWLNKAADRGDADAQIRLGILLYEGNGPPKNLVLAHKWLNLVAARMAPEDADLRRQVVELRDRAAADMTEAGVAEAQALARNWNSDQ